MPKYSLTHQKAEQRDFRHAVLSKAINLSYALLPWREDFNEDSTLLCALDRIFDEATVFKLRGESFRGKKLDTVSVQTGKVKAVELLADQQEE